MRPRFSVVKVGIAAGGIAPEVFELPADCARSWMLMSSVIAAVNIIFVVRIVIYSESLLCSVGQLSLHALVQYRLRAGDSRFVHERMRSSRLAELHGVDLVHCSVDADARR